jgi:hypothetical protein
MEVISIEDLEDGGANMTIECSHEELVELAKIGIIAALEKVVEEHKEKLSNDK